MREIDYKDFEKWLDNEWDNMSIPNKAIALFGDTFEAEERFRESDYYEEKNENKSTSEIS